VIRDFAYPLPTIVIAEMLGVPTEDQDLFKRWSDDLAEFFEGVGEDYAAIARKTNQSAQELTNYLGRLFAQRRQQPRADLISTLVVVEEKEGDRLNEAELFGMCSPRTRGIGDSNHFFLTLIGYTLHGVPLHSVLV